MADKESKIIWHLPGRALVLLNKLTVPSTFTALSVLCTISVLNPSGVLLITLPSVSRKPKEGVYEGRYPGHLVMVKILVFSLRKLVTNPKIRCV